MQKKEIKSSMRGNFAARNEIKLNLLALEDHLVPTCYLKQVPPSVYFNYTSFWLIINYILCLRVRRAAKQPNTLRANSWVRAQVLVINVEQIDR